MHVVLASCFIRYMCIVAHLACVSVRVCACVRTCESVCALYVYECILSYLYFLLYENACEKVESVHVNQHLCEYVHVCIFWFCFFISSVTPSECLTHEGWMM